MANSSFYLSIMTLVAIVLMWRGLWGLLDEYLLPKNRKLSYWISSLLGLALVAAVLLFTPSYA